METPPSHWLLERIAGHGTKPFLHTTGGSWHYAQLAESTRLLSGTLREAGVAPGEVVALVGDYSFDSIALLLALIANHNIVVPLTPALETEIARRLDIARVARVCRLEAGRTVWSNRTAGEDPPALLVRLAAERHSGLVLFSSGSTGQPKAMVHDLDRMLDTYRERRARSLTLLVFLMFDHIGGLNTLFTSLATGATMVIPGSREPDAICELIARHRVAILPASPTFLNLLLLGEAWRQHDLGSLKIITYGTEPMPESLLRRLRVAFPAVKFLQTFGTSETGITHTRSKSSDSTLLKLDDPNLEHRLVDGELWLRSRTQILGYLNHSMQAFTDDGWFQTGDLVELADDGYLRIIGRRSEVINVGGEKVLPAEVESVLLTMPGIADCLVSGESSPITGQIVCAQVVLAPDADPAAIRQQVRLFCRDRLAGYKVPVKVEVVARTNFSDRFKKLRPHAQAKP